MSIYLLILMLQRLLILVLLSGCHVPATAQVVPRPAELVQAWTASQRERAARLSRVELHETSAWTIDGPFRRHHTRMEAQIQGGPDVDGWPREPVAVEVNGRPVPLHRWHDFDQRRRHLMGRSVEEAAQAAIFIYDVLDRLVPVGRVTRDAVDDVSFWRTDLVPPQDQPGPLERFTLWFDRTQNHLVRSRAVLQPRRSEIPIIVTTTYERIDGFDVPIYRHIEGASQTRRRMRTYTALFTFEAQYDDYHFVYRDL